MRKLIRWLYQKLFEPVPMESIIYKGHYIGLFACLNKSKSPYAWGYRIQLGCNGELKSWLFYEKDKAVQEARKVIDLWESRYEIYQDREMEPYISYPNNETLIEWVGQNRRFGLSFDNHHQSSWYYTDKDGVMASGDMPTILSEMYRVWKARNDTL